MAKKSEKLTQEEIDVLVNLMQEYEDIEIDRNELTVL